MKSDFKTNVMRILDRYKIPYNHYTYADTGAISGIEVATVLNQNPDMVFKTLVTVAKSKKYYVFMIPVAKELDLKKAAASVNEKSVLLKNDGVELPVPPVQSPTGNQSEEKSTPASAVENNTPQSSPAPST